MKSVLIPILFFFISIASAQKNELQLDEIAQSEMKMAHNKMNFVANPNTNNYDITYHKLEFTVDPAVHFIEGKVTTTFKALTDMSSITFDLSNDMLVTSVKQNGIALNFNQNTTDELVIILPKTQILVTDATVEIIYSGVPSSTGFGAFTTTTHAGVPILWTLSEPFGAMEWWPCKQDLNDKVDAIDVYITAPSQYVSVANGIEPESPVINGKLKTTHFHHNYPIPAYLVAIAVTNYSIYNQLAGAGPIQFPIINYLYPEEYESNIVKLDQTPLILGFYESKFTSYPFNSEKYGHAQFSWGGGMEHTTVSFMANFNRGLIAHEMAHQWFGDKITCGSWKDIWLNEGFATYLSSLVIEHFDGQDSFVNNKSGMINNITSLPYGAVYLTDAEATDESRIFSSRLTYNKGAMVLNMLRFKLGDELFFKGIQNYLNDSKLAYAYAKTPDLQSHLETVSGLNLSEFFNDWVYNQGYPIYEITASNITTGKVQLTINQTQSDPSVNYFEMPVPIRLLGIDGKQLDVVLNNTFNNQSFIVDVPFEVSEVVFDPNKDIISKDNIVSLSTNSPKLENAIVVYPNPSRSLINIDLPNNIVLKNVFIYNALGQKVSENNSKDISIINLSNGVYSIEINTSEGSFHKKFIKN